MLHNLHNANLMWKLIQNVSFHIVFHTDNSTMSSCMASTSFMDFLVTFIINIAVYKYIVHILLICRILYTWQHRMEKFANNLSLKYIIFSVLKLPSFFLLLSVLAKWTRWIFKHICFILISFKKLHHPGHIIRLWLWGLRCVDLG